MPRTRTYREPCDCLDCTDAYQVAGDSADRAALQDPPPRGLIIYASDVLCRADELGTSQPGNARPFPHLDGVAKDGWSGMLAFHTGKRFKQDITWACVLSLQIRFREQY